MGVRSDFTGGNIELVRELGSTVYVRQELRDTTTQWFYWRFRAEDYAGKTVDFRFCDGEVVSPIGPAVMRGGEWSFLGADSVIIENGVRAGFRCSFAPDETAVDFAFSPCYVPADFERFCDEISGDATFRRFTFCVTEHGDPLPAYTFGEGRSGRHIFFTARHHACEATGSYVQEGAVRRIIESKSELYKNFAFTVIPFVDLDGVNRGDQGKNRAPHDHNRDYIQSPVYAYTRAMYDYSRGKTLAAGIDFHSPWAWGDNNDYEQLIESYPGNNTELYRFADILTEVCASPSRASDAIPFGKDGVMRFGVGWNTGSVGNTCTSFNQRLGAKLSFSLESPYFGRNGITQTPARLREFGARAADAADIYFRR